MLLFSLTYALLVLAPGLTYRNVSEYWMASLSLASCALTYSK
jgi:hypothetical protein